MVAVGNQLKALNQLEGYIGSCVVDCAAGVLLASNGGSPQIKLDLAGIGNCELLQAKRRSLEALGLEDQVEEIVVTLSAQYHVIQPVGSGRTFLYLVLERDKANLAESRQILAKFATELLLS